LHTARSPIHPSEILAEDLAFLDIKTPALASELDIPDSQVAEILNGERDVSADIVIRLSHWLGTSPELWLSLQSNYEQQQAEGNDFGGLCRDCSTPGN
jgi:addiction module HigA family antidote